MEKGYWMLALHAHLPFVRHPEYKDTFEERWLYEAIFETYIPLLQIFERLERDKVYFRLTMSLTPPLINMLNDTLLRNRFQKHLENLIELTEKEIKRTEKEPEFHSTAQMYNRKLRKYHKIYLEVYKCDLVRAFNNFQEKGNIEIITCGATHGFFPLIGIHRECVRAQIEVAVNNHKDAIHRAPAGIWLPECGYNPGDDEILKAYGINFFFVDSHGVFFSNPMPRYGTYTPVYCPSGVAVFARDIESSRQVWSSKGGYPGDFDYREFYRDAGYDLDMDYIKPYIHESGIRVNTGIKYHRVTGHEVELADKKPYSYDKALAKTRSHAEHFVRTRYEQIEYCNNLLHIRPLIVSPYDAELYGHWWYEGPYFLEHVFRIIDAEKRILPVTPVEYLGRYPLHQIVVPSASSWGHKGYNEYWLNPKNDWIYRHLHRGAEKMIELANIYKNHEGDELKIRALNQCARELLLAQSSDWAFIMRSGTTVEYATKRTKEHLSRLNTLYEEIKSENIKAKQLELLEKKDNIFPQIDYRVYCSG